MNSTAFRAELDRLMPGYLWTVHRTPKYLRADDMPAVLVATGTWSSGSNRLSTVEVTRRDADGRVAYTAKSSGYGTRARWLHESTDGTLARALRGLQDHYQAVAATYRSHAEALQRGRIDPAQGGA